MNEVVEKKKLGTKIQAALDKAVKKIIDEQKQKDGYIVISDEAGNIKKIAAKDL